MIRISIGNGKTVSVKTLDQALNFDFQEALAHDSGYEIADPFAPVRGRVDGDEDDEWTEDDEPDEEEIFMIDILDISDIEELPLDEV